jgi:hypothetical protein
MEVNHIVEMVNQQAESAELGKDARSGIYPLESMLGVCIHLQSQSIFAILA